MHAVNLELIYEHDLYKFNYILNGGGLDERSSEEGGSGCCGNIEAGMPPGNTGNTVGTWGLWPSMADSTLWCPARLVVGLDRSCGPLGRVWGREIAASLNRCSVKEVLWWGIGVRGILVRKGRVGTMYGNDGLIRCLFL